MKIDKEYPATHSMSTAWYLVDDDDNVAIMQFDDNGPIPVGVPQNGNFAATEQIILVPQRFGNTPTPRELAKVAKNRPFQSPSCLLACTPPSHFASVTWDKKVGKCSFTAGKEPLPTLNFEGLCAALSMASFKSCLS